MAGNVQKTCMKISRYLNLRRSFAVKKESESDTLVFAVQSIVFSNKLYKVYNIHIILCKILNIFRKKTKELLTFEKYLEYFNARVR